MSERIVTKPLGALVAEGKTKKIHAIKGKGDLVTVVAKDDITAGDGAKHDIIPDKGRLATATTGRPQPLSRRNTLQVVAVASRPLSGMMSCLAPSPAVMSSLATTVTRSP